MGIKYFMTIMLLLFVCVSGSSQTKLGKAKKSISNTGGSKKKDTGYIVYTGDSGSSNSSNDDDSNFFVDLLISELGWPLIKLAALIPYSIAIESPWEMEKPGHSVSLTPYSFYNAQKGGFSYEQSPETRRFTATISDRFVFENRNIQGNHVNFNMQFWKRFGLEIDHLLLWENNPNFGKDQFSMIHAWQNIIGRARNGLPVGGVLELPMWVVEWIHRDLPMVWEQKLL